MQTVTQVSSLWQLIHPIKVIRMQLTRELQGQLNTSSVFLFTVPPLTLNTLIYPLISRISLTRDYSPPETNQLTHRDYCSVYAQVNLHLKSYSHACASVSLEINSQGVYWESQKGVWGHHITWSDLHHSAALHLFRTHPKRAAKSLSKVEHIGLWLYPPALAALDICCSQTNINSTLKLLHIMPWAHRLLDPFSTD